MEPNTWTRVVLYSRVSMGEFRPEQIVELLSERGTFRIIGRDGVIRECKIRDAFHCPDCDCIVADAFMSEEFITAAGDRVAALEEPSQ